MVTGIGGIGSIRDITIVSSLPAKRIRERLEGLDDNIHVMKLGIIGGNHKLRNYRYTVSLHQEEEEDSGRKTTVIKSYVVDVPVGNSKGDTIYSAETIIGCNLRSLANVAEEMATLNL